MTAVQPSQSHFPRRGKPERQHSGHGFFLMFWILWGVDLFGAPSVPELPWFTIALIPFALFLGFSIYGRRKQRALAPLINHRFAEEFDGISVKTAWTTSAWEPAPLPGPLIVPR